MISKPVTSRSFKNTCRYVCNKQGAEVLEVEGVRQHDYKLMAKDFETQKQLRPSKSQACFHAILSFYPAEKPSDETMKEIAKKYLRQLGIIDTQYAICKHTDKAHLHLHIIANMVNNRGEVITDSWIGLRGKKVAQQLTQEYKLIPAFKKKLTLTNLEALSQAESIKYKIYIAISENLPQCNTMSQLENRLKHLGVETQFKLKGQTEERQGVSFKMGNICFKGSQVDRKFSLSGLEKTMELQRKLILNQQQKAGPFDDALRQKNSIQQKFSRYVSEIHDKETSTPLAHGIEKSIEILLKPEDTDRLIPDKLLQKPKQRKRKKQSRGI